MLLVHLSVQTAGRNLRVRHVRNPFWDGVVFGPMVFLCVLVLQNNTLSSNINWPRAPVARNLNVQGFMSSLSLIITRWEVEPSNIVSIQLSIIFNNWLYHHYPKSRWLLPFEIQGFRENLFGTEAKALIIETAPLPSRCLVTFSPCSPCCQDVPATSFLAADCLQWDSFVSSKCTSVLQCVFYRFRGQW